MEDVSHPDEAVRSPMEPLTGNCVKEIRIHDSRQAHELTRRLGGETLKSGATVFGQERRPRESIRPGAWLPGHNVNPGTQSEGFSGYSPQSDPGRHMGQHRRSRRSAENQKASGLSDRGMIQLSVPSHAAEPAVQRLEGNRMVQRTTQSATTEVQFEDSNEDTGDNPDRVNPHVIANLVYRMMMRDLVIERERKR